MAKPYNNSIPKPPGSKYFNPPDAENVKQEFAKRLQSKLTAKHYNQSDLARAASKFLPKGKELTRDLVSNYVRGLNLPRPPILAALAKALDCDVEDLLPLGSVNTVDSDGPTVQAKTLENGAMWLKINAVVPMNRALKILALLEDEETPIKANKR